MAFNFIPPAGSMYDSPQQLRRQAEHCRDLANGLSDERTRMILNGMAKEYDDQAREFVHPSSTADDT